MFFKQKPCTSCEGNLAELKRLQEQVAMAKLEHSRLSELLDTLRLENSRLAAPKPTDDQIIAVPEVQADLDGEHKRRKAALAGGFSLGSITLREEIVENTRRFPDYPKPNISEPASSIISEPKSNSVEKTRMSDQDRLRLQQKRADLKARLGPSPKEIELEGQIQEIKKACEQHFPALLRNLKRSQIYNEYNALVSDNRTFECGKFLDSLRVNYDLLEWSEACKLVIETVENLEAVQVHGGFSANEHPEDGWEFEHWVAEALQKFGWQARATQGSGDQGVDVVATKDGLSLGIQCKRYSGSVGNKAVQEAFSGAKHMGLNRAAVLTNAEFTKSARELAVTTSVLLLSPEDIPTLSERPDLSILGD